MATKSTELVTGILDAMADAIASADLQAAANLGGPVKVVKGWPSQEALEWPATVSLYPGDDDWTHESPDPVEENSQGGGTVEVIYRVASLQLDVQLDLWTGGDLGKTSRYKLLPHLLDLFGAKFEQQPSGVWSSKPAGLELTLADHYNAPCRVHMGQGKNMDAATSDDGVFRWSAPLMAETERRKTLTTDEAQFNDNTNVT